MSPHDLPLPSGPWLPRSRSPGRVQCGSSQESRMVTVYSRAVVRSSVWGTAALSQQAPRRSAKLKWRRRDKVTLVIADPRHLWWRESYRVHPRAQPRLRSTKRTAFGALKVPVGCVRRVASPSIVPRTVPRCPTVQAWFESAAAHGAMWSAPAGTGSSPCRSPTTESHRCGQHETARRLTRRPPWPACLMRSSHSSRCPAHELAVTWPRSPIRRRRTSAAASTLRRRRGRPGRRPARTRRSCAPGPGCRARKRSSGCQPRE